MEEKILAYCAGLFDGEGCVEIYSATPPKASKSPSFYLRVTIVQKEGLVMNWLEDNFGGYVAVDSHGGYYIHRWDIRSKQALEFLKLIYPFLIVKKEQVKVALEFEEMKGRYWDSLKGHQGFRRLTEKEINKRSEYRQKLKDLKRKYSPYIRNGINFTATETKRKNILK